MVSEAMRLSPCLMERMDVSLFKDELGMTKNEVAKVSSHLLNHQVVCYQPVD